MTRSTVPGYLASTAAWTLAAVAPVTGVPKPGPPPGVLPPNRWFPPGVCAPPGPAAWLPLELPLPDDALPTAAAPTPMTTTATAPAAIFLMVWGDMEWAFRLEGSGSGSGGSPRLSTPARPGDASGEQDDGRDDRDRGQGEEPGAGGVGALAHRVDDAERPEEHGEAVQRAPAPLPDPAARVVGQAEQQQAPAGDDPGSRPQGLEAADERDRDVGQARVHVLVADQREPVDDQCRQRGQRHGLVRRAQIEPAAAHEAAAHQQPDADAQAGQQERRRAGRAADQPEQ